MHSTALVFALFFTSMAVAAPVTPSVSVSEVATQAIVAANIAVTAVPAGDILSTVVVNDQSEIHVPEVHSSAEKTRRRSFRRRHP
ncbi:hypothetical protein B0H12DRAFT_1124370 [Mycena haematopus]|nr:hypothetical protein B0H12DRAFT_1124370 [Mycena haematopus]